MGGFSNGIFAVESSLWVNRCNFPENRTGILWYSAGSGGGVFNSRFSSNDPINSLGLFLTGLGRDMEISDCIFESTSLEVQGVTNAKFSRCEVFGSRTGIQIENSGEVIFQDCSIHDIGNVGISLLSNSRCWVKDCVVSGAGSAVWERDAGQFSAQDSKFFGGIVSVLQLSNVVPVSVRHCDFLKGTSDY